MQVAADFKRLSIEYPSLLAKLKRAVQGNVVQLIEPPKGFTGYLYLNIYGKQYSNGAAAVQLFTLLPQPEDIQSLYMQPFGPSKTRGMKIQEAFPMTSTTVRRVNAAAEDMIGGRYQTDPTAPQVNNIGRSKRTEPFTQLFDPNAITFKKTSPLYTQPFSMKRPFQELDQRLDRLRYK